MRRVVLGVLVLATSVAAGTFTSNFAGADPGSPTAIQPAKKRVGGKVKPAWPRAGKPPAKPLARWLARQVGPVKKCGEKRTAGPKAKRIKANKQRRRCLRWHRKIGVRTTASVLAKAGDPGAPVRGAATPTASISATPLAAADPILLARSYQIPKDDPDYERLLNWSFTYDSAITAAAFIALSEKSQATQVLDQLAALQFTNGAIDIAFNVSTGEGAGLYRSGNTAWIGLAAASYNLKFGTNKYLSTARRAADFLIGLQGSNGLVRGGPGLSWSSTLHNLVAYSFLQRMATADLPNTLKYTVAANKIASAIDSSLLVNDSAGLRFIQGLNDTVEPLDVQALGAMYLWNRGRFLSANLVMNRVADSFGVSKVKIQKSTNPDKYNNTWSSTNTFSGYKPYNSNKVPAMIWYEGTSQVRAATSVIGGSTTTLDAEAKKWRDVTSSAGGAPLQSNETITETKKDFDVEYHVWPATVAAGWAILSTNEPRFLFP